MLCSDAPTLDRYLVRLLSRSALTPEEREVLLALPCSASKWKAGHDLVQRGDAVSGARVVVDGLVSSFRQNRDGSRQIVALHINGDMADLPSLMFAEAVSGLQALTDVSLLVVSLSGLQTAANSYPAIARALRLDAAVDASIQLEWAANIGRKSARSRVAHLLCEMRTRYEQAGRYVGLSFELGMTQENMSDATAMTSVHLNRTLTRLRNEGIVDMRRRLVRVLDWSKLTALAGFDPHYMHLGNGTNRAASAG